MPKPCAFCKKTLVDAVRVRNPKHIPFIHKTRPDFRPDDEICLICRNTMEYMYEYKKMRAKKLHDSRKDGVSTLSSSSMDSIDSIVHKTPKHRKFNSMNIILSRSKSSQESGLSVVVPSSQLLNSQQNTEEKNSNPNENQLRNKRDKPRSNSLEQSGLSQELPSSQSLNSQQNVGQENTNPNEIQLANKNVKPKTAQENPTFMTASIAIPNRSLVAVRKHVIFNNEVTATTRSTRQKNNEPVFTPTVYTDDAEVPEPVFAPLAYTDDAEVSTESLDVRLSQQPTTSPTATVKTRSKVIAGLRRKSNEPVFTPTVYTDDDEVATESLDVRLSQQPTTSPTATVTTRSKVITELRQKSNEPVFTPTVYTDEAELPAESIDVRLPQQPTTIGLVAAVTTRSKVIGQTKRKSNETVFNPPVEVPSESLGIRLSQQPTTSAAARSEAQKEATPTTSKAITKIKKGIRNYFQPLQTPPFRVSSASTDIEIQPSTSGLKRPLRNHVIASDTESSDSEDNVHSLNYYNPEVRFPQYQPIPKRRQFLQDNPQIMDIYLKGTTGG